jgi:2-oxoglutarate ferredoxin oxidoreductase subunit alpha
MSDLDLGMNDHFSPPLSWDPQRTYDRGKVLDAAQLDALTTTWGRYRDIDGDGICFRTYPGTHPSKGVYFTRGTSRDEYSAYTEDSATYVRNMERLQLKWESAKRLLPLARIKFTNAQARLGVVFYGSTTPAAYEAIDILRIRGIAVNSMRIRAFPFQQEVIDFIQAHELVFIIEQNRDGQMRTLLINEGNLPPHKLIPITSYDGLPVASRFLTQALEDALAERGVILQQLVSGQGGAQ